VLRVIISFNISSSGAYIKRTWRVIIWIVMIVYGIMRHIYMHFHIMYILASLSPLFEFNPSLPIVARDFI